jgi:hypothetical protein
MAKETAVVSNEVYASQVKLFGKWNCDEVNVEDISLRVKFIFNKLFICVIALEKKIHLSRITYLSKAKQQSIYHTLLVAIK